MFYVCLHPNEILIRKLQDPDSAICSVWAQLHAYHLQQSVKFLQQVKNDKRFQGYFLE